MVSLIYLLFSIIEGLRRVDLGDNLLGQLLLSVLHGLLCQLLLLLGVIEDGRHVLTRGTACWVVVLPEHLEHGTVVGLLAVKHYLHSLCVVATEREMITKTEVGIGDETLENVLVLTDCSRTDPSSSLL